MQKIGCKHSELIRMRFTKIEQKGIDLGNVEVKETTKSNSYKIKQSDLNADFILFFNHQLERFYICKSESFHFNIKETHFRHTAILKRTLYSCSESDYDLFYEIMNKILKNKVYIPEVFRV